MVDKIETQKKIDIKEKNKTEVPEENDSSRKLASIQLIKEIVSHSNADKLNIAKVLGWEVVCAKSDNLEKNDKVIYFEIDSLLPSDKKWCEFMKDKKYRLKTCKLRGVLSQGLIMPLKILEEYNLSTNPDDYEENQDLTKILDIKKYLNDSDEDMPTKDGKISTYPSEFGFSKTDEPRIQSSPKLLGLFKGKPYYATLKYDGTSSTYFMDYNNNKEFYICSRNQRRPYDVNDVYSISADKYKIKEVLEKCKGKYAIQGETFGPKIQKNPLELKALDFVVFNVYDYEDKKYLDYQQVIDFCKSNGLNFVDVILEGESFDYDIEKLKELSKGFYKGTKNHREGLVFRLKNNFWTNYERASFKIINDDFLLQKK